MMSDGFITKADFQKTQSSEFRTADLQITDSRIGTASDDDIVIEVFINENGSQLSFTLSRAKAFVEAMQEIISRYE